MPAIARASLSKSVTRRVAPELAMGLYYAVYFGGWGVFFPYLNVYLHSRGWTGTQIGIVSGLGPVVGIVARPIWGYVADILGKKREVLVLLSVAIAATGWLYQLPTTFAGLIAAAVAVVLFQSTLVPIADSAALDVLEGRSHQWGRVRLWGSFAFAATSWGAGLLYSRIGLSFVFILYAGLNLCAAGVALLLPARGGSRVAGAAMGPNLSQVLRTPGFLGFVAAIMLWQVANQAAAVFLGISLQGMQAPTWSIGAAWSLMAMLEGLALRLSPKVVARCGLRFVLLVAAAGQIVRLLGLGWTRSVAAVLFIQASTGVAMGAYLSGTVLYVNRVFPPQWRATGQSVLAALGTGLGALIGSAVSGRLLDLWGVFGMYNVMALVAGGSLLLLCRLDTGSREQCGEEVKSA